MNDIIHELIEKRFNNTGKLIFMATSIENTPYIRALTPYYKKGSFYFISDQSSEKVRHIAINNSVALCGEWFNAKAKAYNLGALKNNSDIKEELTDYCHSWIELGHIDIESENTCVIKADLIHGYIVENNQKYTF